MSVSKAFDDLFNYFNTPANWTLTPAPARVLEDPAETLNLADFPALVLAYDWHADHEIQYHADSRSHHKYYVSIYLFLGGKATPLPELHQRALQPWPVQIARILFAHLTLGGDIEFLGAGTSDPFLKYRVGFWPWGGVNEQYWGFRFNLIVNEEGIENYQA